MNIVVIGGTGTIGQAIVAELSARHNVIALSRNSDPAVDIESDESIHNMYQQILTQHGHLDAMVVASGVVHFGALQQMTAEQYQIGLQNKLMGQVKVVLHGMQHLSDGGSFTLTSGILNVDPIATGSSAAMVNAAVEGFVVGSAIEMPRGIRINAVSPTVITEALPKYSPYFRGYPAVDAARAAMAFSKSVEGKQTGQVYCVHG